MREWRALAAGGAVCTADVATARHELEELQAEIEGDIARYGETYGDIRRYTETYGDRGDPAA